MLDHELDERRDLILDDVQARVWPKEAGGKAYGQVDAVHAVDLFVSGDAVEEGHQVLQEKLVLLWKSVDDSEGYKKITLLYVMPTQLYMYVCMKCSRVLYYWMRAQINYFSLPLDVLYSCTDVRNVIGSDKFRVTT